MCNNNIMSQDIFRHTTSMAKQKVRGVTMDDSHGCPLVCYRFCVKSGQHSTTGGVVGNSADDVDKDFEVILEAVTN